MFLKARQDVGPLLTPSSNQFRKMIMCHRNFMQDGWGTWFEPRYISTNTASAPSSHQRFKLRYFHQLCQTGTGHGLNEKQGIYKQPLTSHHLFKAIAVNFEICILVVEWPLFFQSPSFPPGSKRDVPIPVERFRTSFFVDIVQRWYLFCCQVLWRQPYSAATEYFDLIKAHQYHTFFVITPYAL